MNLKQKWKRFWSLRPKANDGFTLVELIVVIAILAILGGIAVPAYSGYVKKADEAADAVLLNEINKAFASACMINGESNYDRKDVEAGISGKKFVYNEPFRAEFGTYFESEDAEFKVFTLLKYDGDLGMFKNEPAKTITIGNVEYYISETAINNFKNATAFSENVDELQKRVDGLSGAYTEFILGVSDEELEEKFGKEYVEYLKENGITDAQMGNATVLYVAGKSANMTAEDAYNQLLGTYNYLQTYKAENDGKTPSLTEYMDSFKAGGDPLATTAMLYGAVTAYVNGPGKEDATLTNQLTSVNDSGSLLTLITSATQNQGFLEYCSNKTEDGSMEYKPSNQFTTDMNGYLGALEGINSSSGAFNGDLGNTGLWTGDNANALLGQIADK